MFKISKTLSSGKKITFEPLTSRIVKLTDNASFKAEEVHDDKRTINAIIYENSISVKVGDILNLSTDYTQKKDEPFEVRYITRNKNGGYLLMFDKRTITSIFILPLIGYTKEWYLWYQYFINAYIDIEESIKALIPKLKIKSNENIKSEFKFIYLLYRFSSDKDFLTFETKIKEHKNYVCTIEPDMIHTIFVMSIVGNKIEDYDIILQGKYSKINNKTKKEILKFHGIKNTNGTIFKVLTKSELRKLELVKLLGDDVEDVIDELYSIINIKNETYGKNRNIIS